MTTLSLPTLTCDPRSVEWQFLSRTLDTVSPYDQTTQTQELDGARWGVILTWLLHADADINAMMSFQARMRGRAGRCYVHNIARPTPQGTALGTPRVNGASQVGRTLSTDGWTPDATLLAGDFFAVGGELKMVVADATADAGGEMSITFEPALRAAPADNAALTVTRPTCVMMLTEDIARWNPQPTGGGFLFEVTLQFVEAFAP